MNNLRTGAAAANVSAHQFTNVGGGSGLAFSDQTHCRAKLAWRAVAALKGIVVNKRLLQGMQAGAGDQVGQSFHRGDVTPVLHHRQG